MPRQNLNRSLRSRVDKLEAKLIVAQEFPIRFGYVLRQLPANHTGQRHMAVVRVVGFDNYRREWCEVEERPGPAPTKPAERLPDVYVTETQMKICFGPDFKWKGV